MAQLIIPIIFAAIIFASVSKGAMRELSMVVGTILGLLGIPVLYTPIRNIIESLISRESLVQGVPNVFAGTYIDIVFKMLVFGAIFGVAKHVSAMFFDAAALSQKGRLLDKIGGFALGIIKVMLLCWIFDFLISASNNPINAALGNFLHQSSVYSLFANFNLLTNIVAL